MDEINKMVGIVMTINICSRRNHSHFTSEMTAIRIPAISALAFVALASAAPQQQYTTPIPIISQTQDGPKPDGSYQLSYETGNRISALERGYSKNPGTPNEGQAVEGSFSYTAPDGQVISLQYLSDDGGFQPQGAHLPTPPPIPPEIQKVLQIIATQPQQDYDERGFPIGGPQQG